MLLISVCSLAIFLLLLFGLATQEKEPMLSEGFPDSNKYFINKHIFNIFFVILAFVSTMRHAFIDTYAYKDIYYLCRNYDYVNNSNLHDMEDGWYYLNYFLNQISSSPKMIMGLVAIVIIFAYVLLIRKYSVDPLFSLLLFFFLQFMDTNNGMRQMLAAGLAMIGYTFAMKRTWSGYLIFIGFVIFGMQFHESVKLVFLIWLLVIGDPFNWKMKITLIIGVVFTVIPNAFRSLLGDLLEDSRYDYYLDYTNGMGFMRAFIVGIVPLVLTFVYLTKYKNAAVFDRVEAILINLTIINSVFVFMGLTTQFWARLTFYTAFAPMIMIPKYINIVFSTKSRQLIKSIAIMLYFIFFAYNIYVNIDYGAMKDFYFSLD